MLWESTDLNYAPRIINYAPRVINNAPRVTLQIVASLTDNSRSIIYDRNMFVAQATDLILYKYQFVKSL
jgi:hypothetical protein